MKKLKRVVRRFHSDRGDSELVTIIFGIILIWGVLMTTVDAGLYFNNRTIVQGAARDAARSVAIMGGQGTASTGTSIEAAYGASRATACDGLENNETVELAYTEDSTPIECSLMKQLSENTSLVNVMVLTVNCGPTQAEVITERTYCNVMWAMKPTPGSPLGFVRSTSDGEAPSMASQNGFNMVNTTVGTSESEVNLSGVDQVARG